MLRRRWWLRLLLFLSFLPLRTIAIFLVGDMRRPFTGHQGCQGRAASLLLGFNSGLIRWIGLVAQPRLGMMTSLLVRGRSLLLLLLLLWFPLLLLLLLL